MRPIIGLARVQARRVGKIARAVFNASLGIRAILPTQTQAAAPSRVGKGARTLKRVERAFMRLCPPYKILVK
jgi:hypothetical protein